MMRKRFLLLHPLALGALVASLAASGVLRAADWSANAPPIGPFHQLEVSGAGEVALVQGIDEHITVEASRQTLARIRIRNEKGRVSIEIDGDRPVWRLFGSERTPSPRIIVYFRSLDTIALSGAIKLEAKSMAGPDLQVSASGATRLKIDALKIDRLRITGSGAFRADLAGQVSEQWIELSGAGHYRAGQLVSDTANLQVSGAGRALLRVEKSLTAKVSGAGNVEYLGNPKVEQDVSGAARIRRRETLGHEDRQTRAIAAPPARLRASSPA